jgi:ubiquinone/menaquinone biosynthesis C-methylase UbiE
MQDQLTQESEHFDRLVTETGSTWWGDRTPAAQVREASRMRILASTIRPAPGAVFVEVGCGIGNVTIKLAELFPNHPIYAIDVSAGAIDYARRMHQRPNVTYAVGDAEHVAQAIPPTDYIVGRSILHHLQDLDAALREFFRVLRPGGAIFFSEPNPYNPHSFIVGKSRYLRRLDDWSDSEKPISAHALAAGLRRAGFTDVMVEPFDFVHPAFPLAVARLTDRANGALCRLPGLRWLAGSLIVHATKP